MKTNEKLLGMVQIAMLAAMLALLSQLAIPMPSNVPLTLQTFAVALCACLGGIHKGVSAVAVYLAVGAVGVPVFSGFRGGFGVLLGYTGGFLWGFLLLACFCAFGIRLKNRWLSILTGCVGVLLCHLCGVLQYVLVTGLPLGESVFVVSLPYLPKDIFMAAIAHTVSRVLQKVLRNAGLRDIS